MKKIFFIIICISFVTAYADAPGKRPMDDSRVTIKSTYRLPGYDFYWKVDYDSVIIFNQDTVLSIPGSGGRPENGMLWAVNKKDKRSTDTIFLENYYAPDFIITIDTVYGNKLAVIKDAVSNGNSETQKDGESSGNKSSHTTRIAIFVSASLIAFILLLWLLIYRRKKS